MIWLLGLLLCFASLLSAETPPPREYPYPPAKTNEDLGVEKPEKIEKDGSYYYSEEKKDNPVKTMEGVEKPYSMDEDGTYYYTDEGKKNPLDPYKGIEEPVEKDSDGAYYYEEDTEKKKPAVIYGEKPAKVKDDGTYMYDIESGSTTNTLSIRAGVYGPPKIEPVAADGKNFESVYGDKSSFVFTLDYDWKLINQVYLKLGSGLTSSQGKGQFVDGANPGIEPKESFQFYIFPTTLSVAYKFNIWDTQILTPYIEGGIGYFGFMETRSDGASTKFGGASVLSATGGLMISLSKFQEGTTMYADYGITQTWLDLQFKQIVGLDSRKDFTSNMITAGFAVGF